MQRNIVLVKIFYLVYATFFHAASHGIKIISGIIPVLMVCSTDFADSAYAEAAPQPVYQVLDVRSAGVMLDYFKRLAASQRDCEQVPTDLEDWENRRDELRGLLWRSLGDFPLENRPALKARITGRLDHGDHCVEKVIYESLPGLYVTALAYVPKKIEGRAPAVICLNGHWRGAKAEAEIQKRCMGLAHLGVVAFCQDVIGTGERAGPEGVEHQGYHGNYRGAAPWIVDRSLLGYIIYECIRAFDYLTERPDVDAKRIICTGASGGATQSLFFAALDERLAGAVPVCSTSDYRSHMGATACVCEIPLGVLTYSDQWEILGLHAPRPFLGISASRDSQVFQPRHMRDTLAKASERVYKLYGAEDRVRGEVFDCGHEYNRAMRELLYNHVDKYLLGRENTNITEPDDLPVEDAAALTCGLPANSQTLQSLTFRRAKELVAEIERPADWRQWQAQKSKMIESLEGKILGGLPDRCKGGFEKELTEGNEGNEDKGGKEKIVEQVREFFWKGHRVEHWVLYSEPGLPVPVVLCRPGQVAESEKKHPAVLIADEQGKKNVFERGIVERLLAAGSVAMLIDYRGSGETAGGVPGYSGAHDYNLSNYSLLCGRPMTGMRVHDVLCGVDFLAGQSEVDPARIAFYGRGIAGLTGVMAAAFDDRIAAVATEEMLDSWVFAEEFHDIGLCYLIPRILTVGDVQHLGACLAPRPLLILNSVDGRRRPLNAGAMKAAGEFTESVYELSGNGSRFQRDRCLKNEVPARLVQWLVGQNSTQE